MCSNFILTVDRVTRSTCRMVNSENQNRISNHLNFYQDHVKKAPTERIAELNREWDTEKVLETNAAFVVLISSLAGYKKSKWGCFLQIALPNSRGVDDPADNSQNELRSRPLGSEKPRGYLPGYCPDIPHPY